MSSNGEDLNLKKKKKNQPLYKLFSRVIVFIHSSSYLPSIKISLKVNQFFLMEVNQISLGYIWFRL